MGGGQGLCPRWVESMSSGHGSSGCGHGLAWRQTGSECLGMVQLGVGNTMAGGGQRRGFESIASWEEGSWW